MEANPKRCGVSPTYESGGVLSAGGGRVHKGGEQLHRVSGIVVVQDE